MLDAFLISESVLACCSKFIKLEHNPDVEMLTFVSKSILVYDEYNYAF